MLDRFAKNPLALIPGVSMDQYGERHAFIQILSGHDHRSEYLKFPFSDFRADKDKLVVEIGKNYFSTERVHLDCPDIKADIAFHHPVPWPSGRWSPGVMGPFTYMPFMQCYHGVVSMDHELSGIVRDKSRLIDYAGGRGYIEKDWGKSFPKSYIWMQCNHFDIPGVSLMASVAKIPWLGFGFVGFLAGLLYKGKLLTFTTYNRSKLIRNRVKDNIVNIVINKKRYQLNIRAKHTKSASLASPQKGNMQEKIDESMNSQLQIILLERGSGKVLLAAQSSHAALEISGPVNIIRK